ncbi:MAG: hypothetical protein ACUVQM_04675 [Candidatus Hadarchaeaceae archaeon]
MVSKICKEYGIHSVLNAAYAGEVMIVDRKKLGSDLVTPSEYKSWAVRAPTVIQAAT